MCNHALKERAVLKYAKYMIKDLVELDPEPELAPHTYPKYPAPVVIHEGGRPVMQMVRWGVWHTPFGASKPSLLTNARNDRLTTVWKDVLATRRCLIPLVGYYEPGTGPIGAKGELLFTMRDRPCFFVAGLWDTDADGITRGHTMVTTNPNNYAARYHDRMPAVLTDEDALAWLGSDPLDKGTVKHLLRGAAETEMQHTKIAAAPKEKMITKKDVTSGDELQLF